MSKINKKDPFSSIFNFTCKDGLVTPATCKYYLLVVNPSDEAFYKFLPLPTIAKITILNVVEFLDLPLKTLPFMKASLVSCETSLFLISKCCQLYQKSLFFSVSFYCMMNYTCSAFQMVATAILLLWIQSMVVQSQNYL